MAASVPRLPLLEFLYQQFLDDRDAAAFIRNVQKRYAAATLERARPLLKTMTRIAQDCGGKTLAQVALNWCICKGTMPIPGAKNAAQAQENAGALGWRLTPEQMAELDKASDEAAK